MVTGAHVCRGCGSTDVAKVVDLGRQPAADYFPLEATPGTDPRWPLELWFCGTCLLVQLGPVRPLLPEPPLAVESATSLAHAERSVKAILHQHPDLVGGSVAEFASHHGGSWLPHLAAAGCRLTRPDERARLVVDVHGIAHEPDLATSFSERVERLAPGGALVLEFHHLLPLFEGVQFDTIRHGHWSYLSVSAVARLAARHELDVVAVRHVPLFGGSVQVTLRHSGDAVTPDASVRETLAEERRAGITTASTLATLQRSALTAAGLLHTRLRREQANGTMVLGYGAPSKAPVLLGLAGVTPALLPFTVDIAPGKHGRRIPGCGIPIRPLQELREARPGVVLVLTWDIADEVVAQLEDAGGWGADYLVPLPQPHLISR